MEPKDILLVTSLRGLVIKCGTCKRKWFDSWVEVDGVKYCGDCFEAKYLQPVKIGNGWEPKSG